jgi:transposase
VSLSPTQRARVLHLHDVEGVSTILIATMTGLSVSVVRKVVEESRQEDVAALDRPYPMRPSSKSRIECQIKAALAALSKKGAAS